MGFLWFSLGATVGAIIGYIVCGLLSINRLLDKDEKQKPNDEKK